GVLGLVRRPSGDGGDVSPVATFVGRHRTGLRGLVIGLGLAILVALSSPSPAAGRVVAAALPGRVLFGGVLGGQREPPAPAAAAGGGGRGGRPRGGDAAGRGASGEGRRWGMREGVSGGRPPWGEDVPPGWG